MERQKRAAAIHDISCFGRCSLTVALPIISAAGVECSVIPTAVLSTHTGGLDGYTYTDLTNDIVPIYEHWTSLGLEFDALYSGFLGSFEQLSIVSELFDKLKKDDNIILVDPVMADNGELYKLFSPEFASGMAKLCSKADMLVPNITEACLMLGEDYKGEGYDKAYIEKLLRGLSSLGPKRIVLTGVSFSDTELGAAVYDARSGGVDYVFGPKIDGYYHGTGDVFGSALLGAVMNSKNLAQSARIAVDFTVESISRTKEAKTDIRFGVNFEQSLPSYIKALGE